MLAFFKNRLGKVIDRQEGFTLIELLVVVGIIVALAAVIVPLVLTFSGSGKTGAQEGERSTMQTLLQAAMVDNNLDELDGQAAMDFINKTDTLATGVTLAVYMLEDVTQFCYTYSTAGIITEQWDVDSNGACDVDDSVFP